MLAFPHPAVLPEVTQTQNQNKPADNRPPTQKQAPTCDSAKTPSNHALAKLRIHSGQTQLTKGKPFPDRIQRKGSVKYPTSNTLLSLLSLLEVALVFRVAGAWCKDFSELHFRT